MRSVRPWLLPLLLAGATFAGESPAPPVTYMGSTLLPRTDAVVLGAPVDSSRLGAGTILTGFRVDEVLRGTLARRRILVLSSDPGYFPLGDPPCVLFLASLGPGRFEPLARVPVTGRDGPARLATLRRYLAIEALPDLRAKVTALHDLLLAHLGSEDPFLVWSAARELAHFTRAHASAFDADEYEILRAAAAAARDETLKELLLTALENLAALRPAPPVTSAESDRPGIRTTLPPPPEFREIERAWAEGGRTADEREILLTALCASHLRHAAPILVEALADAEPAIRVLAARNLGETLSPLADEALRSLLATERHLEVLEAAVQSLGVLEDAKALSAIRELMSVPALTRACAFAAARIGGEQGRALLAAIRADHPGDAPEDAAIRDLLDFLASETFLRQEEALKEIRRQRLR